MIRRVLILLLLASSSAHAAEAKPQDFAYGMPVLATELATAYRVSLPLEVYRNSARTDLGDVRVFNAGGEQVAYAILRRTEPAVPPAGVALPLFALRGDTRAAIDGLKLTLSSPQGSVHVQTAPTTLQAGAVEQYVLDGRPLDVAVAALRLSWAENSADFSGRLRVEASDDFSDWRTVTPSAPIANLHALGQELIENRIDIPAIKAKFWRLTWLGAKPPFELAGVEATPQLGPPRTEWSSEFVNGVAEGGKGEFVFDLGAGLPVERLNLALPESNTIYMVEMSSRAHEQDAWVPVTRAGVYRLSTADGEQRNNAASIHLTRDRFWRARILGAGNAPPSLRLEATWSPPDIEFLAQGNAPYLLAFGNRTATPAESDLGFLPKSATIARATLGPRAALGGESRLDKGAVDWKRTLLWAVLVAAVAILAVMARRVARGSRTGHN